MTLSDFYFEVTFENGKVLNAPAEMKTLGAGNEGVLVTHKGWASPVPNEKYESCEIYAYDKSASALALLFTVDEMKGTGYDRGNLSGLVDIMPTRETEVYTQRSASTGPPSDDLSPVFRYR